MACLMAGRLGCGGGPPIFFFPTRGLEAAGLKEGIGHHGHQSVSVQPEPRSAFEVVEAKFLLHLLMRLLQTHLALIVAARVLRLTSAGRLDT